MINFPSTPIDGNTYVFQGVTYIYRVIGGKGFWTVEGPGTVGVATGVEVDTGTDNFKYVTPFAMENSSYAKEAYVDQAEADANNYTDTGLAGKSDKGHGHSQTEVSGLTTALNAKADKVLTISTGTGLLGGGDLSTNRTFSIDRADTTLARAHTSNDYVMTPVRTFEAFNQYGLGDRAKQVSSLNTIVKSGLYMADVGATGNPASDGWVTVLHIEHGGTGWATQQAHCFSGQLYPNRVWYREKYNGTWQSWSESMSLTSSGLNGSGYWRLWSDGFKEQWGESSTLTSSSSPKVLYFPIAFTDVASIEVQLTSHRTRVWNYGNELYARNETASSCIIECSANDGAPTTRAVFWRAQGY